MNLEILKRAGLSEGEIKVYEAILTIGTAPINKIHEKTGIERRNIYDIVNKLIKKGLINYTDENKKRSFQLANPKKIISYIEERKSDLTNLQSEINEAIPQINSIFNSNKQEIMAEVYRGFEGIKAVWDDMLNSKDIYWIGSGRYVPNRFPNFFSSWNRKRIGKKIKMHNLLRNEMKEGIEKFEHELIKFLPKEFSGNPTVIGIYNNKVVNFLLGENLFAFVTESNELAENYKKYHKYLWDKVAKK